MDRLLRAEDSWAFGQLLAVSGGDEGFVDEVYHWWQEGGREHNLLVFLAFQGVIDLEEAQLWGDIAVGARVSPPDAVMLTTDHLADMLDIMHSRSGTSWAVYGEDQREFTRPPESAQSKPVRPGLRIVSLASRAKLEPEVGLLLEDDVDDDESTETSDELDGLDQLLRETQDLPAGMMFPDLRQACEDQAARAAEQLTRVEEPPKDLPMRSDSLYEQLRAAPVTACECPHCGHITHWYRVGDDKAITCPVCSQSYWAPAFGFAPGAVVHGDFVIDHLIGMGANGIVYRARQISLRRHVALKAFAADGENGVRRFRSECLLIASLQHGHIVQAYTSIDLGYCGLLVMEYVNGPSLESLMDIRSVSDPIWVVALAINVVDALEFAWDEAQIVHRDIKPANIMIDERDRPKLADFGLAFACTDPTAGDDMVDTIVGSPAYVSPEIIMGQEVDYRTDIYSLGIVLYQLLTGAYPYHIPDDVSEMLQQHVVAPVTAPHQLNPDVPDSLSQIVMRMMAKSPDGRHATHDALITDLKDCLRELVERSETPTTRLVRRLI